MKANKLKSVINSKGFEREKSVRSDYKKMKNSTMLKTTFKDVVDEKVESH